MCLVAVALDAHPRYALAIAANRDEFHDRAAEPAHWWREGWLAGRDLEAGGTWFGVRRDGRWALVTNVREPGKRDALAASRGGIVTDALSAPAIDAFAQWLASHWRTLQRLQPPRRRRARRAVAVESRGRPARARAGRHRPVQRRARARRGRRSSACRSDARMGGDRRGVCSIRLLDALGRPRARADAKLPSTGVPLDWERLLSAPFIVSERYGTRCSTVLVVGRDGEARLVERTFDASGATTGTGRHALPARRLTR
jgi:uncharacterized protein with NRDE domain